MGVYALYMSEVEEKEPEVDYLVSHHTLSDAVLLRADRRVQIVATRVARGVAILSPYQKLHEQ